jgi:hypothetical protein
VIGTDGRRGGGEGKPTVDVEVFYIELMGTPTPGEVGSCSA